MLFVDLGHMDGWRGVCMHAYIYICVLVGEHEGVFEINTLIFFS